MYSVIFRQRNLSLRFVVARKLDFVELWERLGRIGIERKHCKIVKM
jgi:hypothetical protein